MAASSFSAASHVSDGPLPLIDAPQEFRVAIQDIRIARILCFEIQVNVFHLLPVVRAGLAGVERGFHELGGVQFLLGRRGGGTGHSAARRKAGEEQGEGDDPQLTVPGIVFSFGAQFGSVIHIHQLSGV